MKIIYVMTSAPQAAQVLEDVKIKERLFSYFHVRSGMEINLENYVKTGTIPVKGKKRDKKRATLNTQ